MCTLEKRGGVYILTLTGNHDHRLNPPLLDSISAALNRIKSETTSSTALITTAQGKYFSNGYDLDWAQSDKHRHLLMSSKLRSLITDLISLPFPTIAAVTGHAAAAGMILALSHDYVLMRKDRGFLYMSELDIGLVVPSWMISVLKTKIRSSAVLRDVVLRAEKMTAVAAVESGVIEAACGSAEEAVREAVELGEVLVKRKWEGNAYKENRKVLYGHVLKELENVESVEDVDKAGVISRL